MTVQAVSVERRVAVPTAVAVAAAASLGAGIVHATAAGTHQGDDVLVRLFAAVAFAQIGWAALAVVRPTRAVIGAGVALQAACIGTWILSRTVGVSFIDALREPERAGTPDRIAVALQAIAIVAAIVALIAPRWHAPARFSVFPLLVVLGVGVLTFGGMVAPHSHDHADGHDHTAGGTATAADGHAHTHTETGPIVSIADARLTSAQRTRAENLLTVTRRAMKAFPDQAAIEAAGYRSIGDSLTGFEHFVNNPYLADGRELDPNHIESIVMQVDKATGTKTVASAMYILERGKTMADAPEIAGELTTWHDHQNLCWDPNSGRVVGVLKADGTCTRGVFRGTPPMLHVWMTDTPCGPFSGIEGHGGDCAKHSHGPS